MALTDLTRISTSGIATGSTIDSPILRKDVDFRGDQVGVNSAFFDSSERRLDFKDNVKLRFGDSGDLSLSHNINDSVISHSAAATGALKILSGGAQSIECVKAGAVTIAHNGNTKIETTSTGTVVTGVLTATSFSGPIVGHTHNTSGLSTFYDLRVSNDLTVEGTTTTIDTNLIGVDRVEVGANSNTTVAVSVAQTGTADIINLFDGTTEVLTVTDGGKVGIGLTNPSSTSILHLRTSANHNLEFEESSGNLRISALNDARDTNEVLQFAASKFNFLTGKVGIGNRTSTPDENLHVHTSSGQANIHVEGATDGQIILRAHSGDSVIHFGDASATSVGKIVYDHGTNSLAFRTNSDERLRILTDGEVGIGITNPAEKFQVNGGNIAITGGSAYKIDTHPLVSYASFSWSGGTYAARLGSTGTSTVRHTQIYGGGSPIATFDGVNTRLGIGYTNPTAKLHIKGAGGTEGLGVLTTDASGNNVFWTKDGGRVGLHYAPLVLRQDTDDTDCPSGSYFYIHHTSHPFVIKNDNKIGVGLTNPEYMMHLKGGVPALCMTDTDGTYGNSIIEQNSDNLKIRCDAGNASSGTGSNISLEVDSFQKMKIHGNYTGTVDVRGIPAHLRLYSQRNTSDWDATDPIGKLDFYVGDDTTNNLPYTAGFIHCLNETDNAGEPSGALLFGTALANASGGALERLRITKDGQIRKIQDPVNRTSLKTYSGEGLWFDHYQLQSSGTYQRYADIVSVGDGSWGSNMRFFTMPNSGSPIERLRLHHNGQVTMGNSHTPSSTHKMRVYQTGGAGGIELLGDASSYAGQYVSGLSHETHCTPTENAKNAYMIHSTYHAEKTFSYFFPHDAVDHAVRIHFPDNSTWIAGYIKLNSTFSYENASGLLTYAFTLNGNGTTYYNRVIAEETDVGNVDAHFSMSVGGSGYSFKTWGDNGGTSGEDTHALEIRRDGTNGGNWLYVTLELIGNAAANHIKKAYMTTHTDAF